MKKSNYLLLVVLSVVFISCGGKNSEKNGENETEVKETSVTDCLISELNGVSKLKGITKKGTKDLFTGTAVEKDQYDTIIKKYEVKNGWVIKEVTRVKVNEKYITNSDFTYENGKVINKYELEISDFCCDDKNNKFSYVREYSPTDYEYGDDYYSVMASYDSYDNTYQVDYESNKTTPPNCIKDFRQNTSSRGSWIITDVSSEKMFQILDQMKNELPHFDYWKK